MLTPAEREAIRRLDQIAARAKQIQACAVRAEIPCRVCKEALTAILLAVSELREAIPPSPQEPDK